MWLTHYNSSVIINPEWAQCAKYRNCPLTRRHCKWGKPQCPTSVKKGLKWNLHWFMILHNSSQYGALKTEWRSLGRRPVHSRWTLTLNVDTVCSVPLVWVAGRNALWESARSCNDLVKKVVKWMSIRQLFCWCLFYLWNVTLEGEEFASAGSRRFRAT